ncbi:MAG: B3/4 domain-containing protein [Chloroflexota bacterium]|nr:B3/4 domain-containing protein [Chloroflexota bacterium]
MASVGWVGGLADDEAGWPFDANRIAGDLQVRYADGDERFSSFSGQDMQLKRSAERLGVGS